METGKLSESPPFSYSSNSREPISKITRAKWTGGMVEAVDSCFTCKKPCIQIPVPPKNHIYIFSLIYNNFNY
jgi:hypothetical protein